ncbi:hypothetical protein RHSIM_Rhsim07G0026700 [Rhododendron simsii]|uniref:PDZ domain-containing protein n=1 Tax=Rhododendron simsii TaxID=118357 RepID=A0A834GLN3_RHOSS|nr:hypothetical protein RHSIM_Rhsim07G0026700 [Rhododendron simsii]
MAPKRTRLAGRRAIQKMKIHMGPWKGRHPKSEDIPTEFKGAIVDASAAVVSLVPDAGPGGETMFAGSGTIIVCEEVNGTYTGTILTSATLLRSTESNAIQEDIEVNVYLADGKSMTGRVSAHDFHFNIATISITSDVPLPTASLRRLDDSISIDPNHPSEIVCPGENEVPSRSFQLHRHSDSFKICPGDTVVALGRHCGGSHSLWAALGKFSACSALTITYPCSLLLLCSIDRCGFDCKELFRANCLILKSGIGGPLVNRRGEVIGVNFYDADCTPFMPINIVSKCLKRFQENRQSRQPWLGMELTNLYAARIGKLKKVISRFNISKGVLVEKVIKGSPAEQAGILRDDIIVQCGNKSVQGFLEWSPSKGRLSYSWDPQESPLSAGASTYKESHFSSLSSKQQSGGIAPRKAARPLDIAAIYRDHVEDLSLGAGDKVHRVYLVPLTGDGERRGSDHSGYPIQLSDSGYQEENRVRLMVVGPMKCLSGRSVTFLLPKLFCLSSMNLFYDVIWQKIGKSVEVVVVRESSPTHLNLKVFVDKTSRDKVNRWTVPKTMWLKILN